MSGIVSHDSCVRLHQNTSHHVQMNSGESREGLQNSLSKTIAIIPMLNECDSIGLVLDALPPLQKVIVVDNGSTDISPDVAQGHGALVIHEPQRGYGAACLAGLAEAERLQEELSTDTEFILFLDADYSDHPEQADRLMKPLASGRAEMVIGSRARGEREAGAMPLQAMFGNWLACFLMRRFWNAEFTDLGPFRAIRMDALRRLNMQDQNFGWTIEMQIKAMQHGLRCAEVPVDYRRRIGASKISGTVIGTCKAGYKILYTIFKYRFSNGMIPKFRNGKSDQIIG